MSSGAKTPKVRLCTGPGGGTPCPHQEACAGKAVRCPSCRPAWRRWYHQQEHIKKRIKEGKKKRGETGFPSAHRLKAKAKREYARRYQMPDTSAWRCTRCGCTERVACPGGCWWVGKELCSSCATPEELYIASVAQKLGQVAALFCGKFKLQQGFQLHVKGKADLAEKAVDREMVRRGEEFSAHMRKVEKTARKGRRKRRLK